MAINCSRFHLINVIDTCAIWNVLSSRTLSSVAKDSKCHFSCTAFVYYEALYKPRTAPTRQDLELQERLKQERETNFFGTCSLDIADLQEVDILEQRKRLGKGELSSIAFAKKTRLAFMTDDQKARKLATNILDHNYVQTTPQLFGWLFYTRRLMDSDKYTVISEHEKYGGHLRPCFEEMYGEALRSQSMDRSA